MEGFHEFVDKLEGVLRQEPEKAVLYAIAIVVALVVIGALTYIVAFAKKKGELDAEGGGGKAKTGYGEAEAPSEPPASQPSGDATTGAVVVRPLPTDIGDFEGRRGEIAQMCERFAAPGGATAVVSALGGMGGIGKTTLAVHVAHKVKDAYAGGAFLVDLKGTDANPPPPEAAMAAVVRTFDPAFAPPNDAEHMAAAYHGLLAERRVLLILDNAEDGAQVRDLVPPPPSAAIVTSRARFTLQDALEFDLEALEEGDAKALLRDILRQRPIDDGALTRLAEACRRLPLALRAAGTRLAGEESLSLDVYLAALDDERRRLEGLRVADKDVGATLGLSAEAVERDDPALAAKWRQLAVFPADFDALAAAAVWGAEVPDKEAAEAAVEAARCDLEALKARTLVDWLGDGRWRLHDLMRDVARLRADALAEAAEIDRAAGRHAAHFMAVLGAAHRQYLQGGESVLAGLALADREWANIVAGRDWAAARAATDDVAARLCNLYPDAGTHVLDLRLHARQYIAWLDDALAAARKIKHRDAEGVHLGNLGVAYVNLGEARTAIGYNERHLEIAREIGDRRGEGNALGNLGNAYVVLGEAQKAIDHHVLALEISREIGDRRAEGQDLGNLGIAYKRLGQARKAIGYHEQQLAMTREIGDHRGEGTALWNSALLLHELGDTSEAVARAEAALAIFEAIDGPDAPKVRATLEEWRAETDS